MSKFSPGPWKTMDDDCVYAMNKLTRIGHILGLSREEQDANVRLIAAAPEMYKLLKNIALYIDATTELQMEHVPDEFYDYAKLIKELLARIDGEAGND